MAGWNDTILNTTSNIGLNYEIVNTVHANKNIENFLEIQYGTKSRPYLVFLQNSTWYG